LAHAPGEGQKTLSDWQTSARWRGPLVIARSRLKRVRCRHVQLRFGTVSLLADALARVVIAAIAVAQGHDCQSIAHAFPLVLHDTRVQRLQKHPKRVRSEAQVLRVMAHCRLISVCKRKSLTPQRRKLSS